MSYGDEELLGLDIKIYQYLHDKALYNMNVDASSFYPEYFHSLKYIMK